MAAAMTAAMVAETAMVTATAIATATMTATATVMATVTATAAATETATVTAAAVVVDGAVTSVGGGVVVHCLMGISGRLGGICPLAEELSTTKKKKKRIEIRIIFTPKIINPSERIFFWIQKVKLIFHR